MKAADRDDHLVGLLFLDLDGFKEINDTHGHSSGDALLQQVSIRLLSCVRGVDRVSRQTDDDTEFVSRLGGDEFLRNTDLAMYHAKKEGRNNFPSSA
jgi:diguanylate cyclase (GGDEF)-like protein